MFVGGVVGIVLLVVLFGFCCRRCCWDCVVSGIVGILFVGGVVGIVLLVVLLGFCCRRCCWDCVVSGINGILL